MIFGPVATADAAGAILAHGALVGRNRWSKGRVLTGDDVDAALAAGLAELVVAQLDPDDVGEDAAAATLAAALAGPGTIALPAAHGRANLAACAAGLVQVDGAAIDRINALGEAIGVATLARFARVAEGEIVATVKVIRYAVAGAILGNATAAAVPVRVHAFRSLRIALIATTSPGVTDKAMAKTLRVTRDRVEALGCTLVASPPCPHRVADLAATVIATEADLILIAGAAATVDRADVVPAAIIAAGGSVARLGMPVDPGNLLVLGHHGDTPVIGLPGCARSPKRSGFDWVLERLVAGLSVDSAAIAAMGTGGLLPEAERPQPRAVRAAGGAAVVGAIILAAGRSTRMGANHKLLALWHGKPLVAHVADAIAAAGLPPPIVVLGARADAVRAALGDRAAHYIVAADYAEGLSHSLRAGLAVVPAHWTAALVCLADMPRVPPAVLAALAAAATGEDVIAVPEWNGKRGNPVLWGRAHFADLMALSGDVGGKALLTQHGDAVVTIAAPDDAILADIDTPEMLAALGGIAEPV